MKYGELNLGQVEAIVNKLGGMKGARLFLSGELVLKEPEYQWKVWKTIKLGSGLKTANDFRRSLKDNGFKVGDWANDILSQPAFTVATEETEIDLVVVSVAELGFKNGATRAQIYARAKERGLDLCHAEVGPQLRLQYADQPTGEWLAIGMEPITHSVGDLRLFRVEHGGDGLWLGSRYGDSGYVWGVDGQWVFVRPRKYQK